jgi:hypothetical protein
LHNVDVVALAAALHFHTFPAVQVHQLEIFVRSTGCPFLVLAAVPLKLLHVCSIRLAISGYVQNQAAICVPDSALSIACIDEFPTLICSTIAVVLLDVCFLVCAASNTPFRSRGIETVGKRPLILRVLRFAGCTLQIFIRRKLHRKNNRSIPVVLVSFASKRVSRHAAPLAIFILSVRFRRPRFANSSDDFPTSITPSVHLGGTHENLNWIDTDFWYRVANQISLTSFCDFFFKQPVTIQASNFARRERPI